MYFTGRLQIIISLKKTKKGHESYKERWQNESALKALKRSGFNIENTNLADINVYSGLIDPSFRVIAPPLPEATTPKGDRC